MSEGYQKDQVMQIINSVINRVNESTEVSKETIFAELTELKRTIEEVRSSIGASSATEITDKHIPVATDELDAVVEATAEATGGIMDACEAIENKTSHLSDEDKNNVIDEITKIYEACSFQDITGQRITKVVNALRTIEEKIIKLVDVLGESLHKTDDVSDADKEEDKEETSSGDEGLLNGPQLPSGEGISQDEIDKLLAEFD